jgi:DNA-binding MarR family transcriptional regulator
MTAKPALPASLRDSPLFLTQRAALALAARYRRALKARGIDDVNPAQLSILAALETDEGATATSLSHTVLYEKSTLTPLLDKLEAAGLILRARDPNDGRIQRLFITKKGRKRRREAEAVLDALTDSVVAMLPKKTLKHHMEFCEAVLAGEEGAAPRAPAPRTTRPRALAARNG